MHRRNIWRKLKRWSIDLMKNFITVNLSGLSILLSEVKKALQQDLQLVFGLMSLC